MTTLRQSLLSALVRQLLRGKSLIQAFLALWIVPTHSAVSASAPGSVSAPAGKSVAVAVSVGPHSPGLRRSAEDFLREVELLVLAPLAADGLATLSTAVKAQFRDALKTKTECMLPSYNHQLPSGRETGRYLALDVGGSTLRVALVELHGTRKGASGPESEIVRIKAFPIGLDVKGLEGAAFFDWMAARIIEVLAEEKEGHRQESDGPLPMALSWSFPIEQTSLRGGRINNMGKGFRAALGLVDQDLGAVIEASCRRAGLAAEVHAIINDGNATLMSCAYAHPATRFGLILGTGVNIAAYLPVPLVGAAKFGTRPPLWTASAHSVIVNTELGMFGGGILPVTRWDALLKKGHPRPDFQPLEHMVSGMYLGEVARFMILEAVETTGLFEGVVPTSLLEPYSFSTETMSIIQGDSSPGFTKSIEILSALHPSSRTPTSTDMIFLRSLSAIISRRSAAIIAASIHAIWQLRLEGLREATADLDPSHPAKAAAAAEFTLQKTMVAYNGSVIESYPGFKQTCQNLIDELVETSSGAAQLGGEALAARIDLVPAKESSILGAGVALAAAMSEAA
ncbi:hexokinase-1 [Plectosphaerella plurivora]|uniref:Phosphotransferase n=1 Tax=Plectosphaerella plurivora TaxID=936078 RepID=A0A9P9A9K4_9PEZI|nr:hexokinase-1 [Plectosphaerella plurivora]